MTKHPKRCNGSYVANENYPVRIALKGDIDGLPIVAFENSRVIAECGYSIVKNWLRTNVRKGYVARVGIDDDYPLTDPRVLVILVMLPDLKHATFFKLRFSDAIDSMEVYNDNLALTQTRCG